VISLQQGSLQRLQGAWMSTQAPPHRASSAIDFVIKISKFCNLRCTYCYEFNELGQRRRMKPAELRRFFVNVRDSVLRSGLGRIHFIWHGGEPLLIPLDYYEQIGAIQREVIGDRFDYANLLQTNLTVLTDRHIAFLLSKQFFNHAVGVSFDVYGDQRVDTRGNLRTDTVLANMQRLRDAGVRFGTICVLARNTLPRIGEIYRFYDSLGIPVRFLPFYKSATDDQIGAHALSFDEITGALKQVFDAWLVSSSATTVTPLDEHLRYALAAISGQKRGTYDPDMDERVFLVDTNGDTYGVADTYAPDRRYGNLFGQGLDALLTSFSREQVKDAARARLQTYCNSCPYFGYCPGRYVAEATPEQRRLLVEDGCPVREIVAHIINRVARTPAIAKLVAARAQAAGERPATPVDA
jgi:uncharacterized protein